MVHVKHRQRKTELTSAHPVTRVTKALPQFSDISPALRFAEESDYSIYYTGHKKQVWHTTVITKSLMTIKNALKCWPPLTKLPVC